MRIHFRSKDYVDVTEEVAKVINERILSGAKQWQSFSDKHGKLFLIINLDHIEFIK